MWPPFRHIHYSTAICLYSEPNRYQGTCLYIHIIISVLVVTSPPLVINLNKLIECDFSQCKQLYPIPGCFVEREIG